MFRDQKAENLGKELIDRINRGQKDPMTMQEAQELLKVTLGDTTGFRSG